MNKILIVFLILIKSSQFLSGQSITYLLSDSMMQNVSFDTLRNKLGYRQLHGLEYDLLNPYWKTFYKVNKGQYFTFDSTNRFEQRYLVKNFDIIDSFSWAVSNFILDDTSFTKYNDHYKNFSDQIFNLRKNSNNFQDFLFMADYEERNLLGSSVFLFHFRENQLEKIPIKKINDKFTDFNFTLGIDSIYEDKKNPYLEFYLGHHRFSSNSYELTEGVRGYVSRLKWNGRAFEQRLLYEWNQDRLAQVPIVVNLDLNRRKEVYYRLKRGKVFAFEKKNYFICSDEFEQNLFVYRCNYEDYDCEFITKLDTDSFHFNDKIKISSKFFSTLVEIGQGTNTLKMKMKK